MTGYYVDDPRDERPATERLFDMKDRPKEPDLSETHPFIAMFVALPLIIIVFAIGAVIGWFLRPFQTIAKFMRRKKFDREFDRARKEWEVQK